MKLYGGIDLHSNNSVLVLIDEQDEVVYEKRLDNKLERILNELKTYRKHVVGLAVESTYNWYWLVDGLMEAGYSLHLVNTAAVKQYDGLKYTDDRHDAKHLAHLLRLGILPQGYIYPKAQRAVRDLLRKRMQLVQQQTANVLSIGSLITRLTGHGLTCNHIKRMTDEGLSRMGIEGEWKLALNANLSVLQCLSDQIDTVEKVVLARVKPEPGFTSLLSVAGVGKILGMTIWLETGYIGRFKQVGNYASYCRCVGSQRLSNGKKKGQGNHKNGNKYLGWAYVEAANFGRRYYAPIDRFYQRKRARTNAIVATKACAHKLARASYYVLRDQVPFDIERAFST